MNIDLREKTASDVIEAKMIVEGLRVAADTITEVEEL